MFTKWWIICLIVGLLLLCPVSASKEVIVDEKRIECGGVNTQPFFIIGQSNLDHTHQEFQLDEYVVSKKTYYSLNIGDKVLLDTDNPDGFGIVEVIKKV